MKTIVYLSCICLAAFGLSSCGSAEKNTPASTVFADGSVLQGQPSNKVYLISGGQKHYIQTPATLQALDVASLIKSVPDSALDKMPTGFDMPSLTTKAIQRGSTGEVYLLKDGKRHYIPNPETLKQLGLTNQVQGVKDEVADAIPLGSPVQSANAAQ